MKSKIKQYDRIEFLKSMAGDDAVILEPEELDWAILGTTPDGRIVYSVEKLSDILIKINNWTRNDANEYIEHNIIYTGYGGNEPVFVFEYAPEDIDQTDDSLCKHETKFYQPAEPETNTPESLSCDDCGVELDVPEYDPESDMEFQEFGDWLDVEKS